MKKSATTSAAVNTAKTSETGNVTKLLEAAKNNAKAKAKSSKGEAFDVEKNAIGVKQHDKKSSKAPKAKKEPRVTIASKMDEAILKGGKWDNIVSAAAEASKTLGGTLKFNVGVIKAHIRFRVKKNPQYLGSLKETEAGLFAKASKKKAA